MKILITRPEPEASELAHLLSSHQTTVWPIFQITSLTTKLAATKTELIFVSKNAVKFYSGPILPSFAVGPGTATALKAKGFSKICYPTTHSGSEALLTLAELKNVMGRNFTIIRGSEGREKIATVLKQRGANISNQIVYRVELNTQLDLTKLQASYDLIIATSTHALAQLSKLLQNTNPKLFITPVTVLAGNMLESALKFGFLNPQVVESFNNAHLRHIQPNLNSR